MEKEQTTIRLSKELKESIQKIADERGFSFNGFVAELIRRGLLSWEQEFPRERPRNP